MESPSKEKAETEWNETNGVIGKLLVGELDVVSKQVWSIVDFLIVLRRLG